MLKTMRSKFQIQEQRIIIKKVIMKSGKNITKDGCKVYIEIVSFFPDDQKKTKRVPTDIWVLPKNWNSKKDDGTVTTKDPDHIEKNASINTAFSLYVVELIQREQGTWNEDFKPEGLISIADMFPKKTKCLVDFIEDYVVFRKNQGTVQGTTKEFTTCKNRIDDFDIYRNKKTFFEDINITWSDNFESYLRQKKNEDGSLKYMNGTIGKTYTILVTILNHYYERRDDNHINLSDKFRSQRFKRGGKSINLPNPLTKEQLHILYNHTFEEKHLELIKTRFCLQSFLGVRYSDLFKIRPENIKDGWLKIKPIKTKRYEVEVNQPLNQYALEILKKYNYDTSSLYITNQAYNRELKDMFPVLVEKYPQMDFKTDYGTHSCRDTFISMCVEAGVNWKSILQWTGQSSYTIMARYAKNQPKHMEEDMKKIFI
jgi:integrase